MAVHDVDPNDYATAATTMDHVGSLARSATTTLAGALGGSGGMAGADKPGESFSHQYDPAATNALRAAANIVNSSGSYAVLLHATGTNHAGADADSTVGGGDSSLPGAPSPTDFSAPSAPSAYGGTKGPDGIVAHIWHMIESYVGYVWPRGHQDRLRAAAGSWKTASTSIGSAGEQIASALALINAQQAPEVSGAAQKHEDLTKDFDSVKEGAQALGEACDQYAQFIDKAHKSLVDMLLEAALQAAAIEAAGAAGALFSFGMSEAAAQAALYTRILAWANKARQIIEDLIEAVKRVVEPIAKLISKLAEIFARLGSKLGRGGKAVEEAADDTEELPSLKIKMKKKWSDDQRAEMYQKIDRFNQSVKEDSGDFSRVSHPPRDPKITREFRKENPLPEGSPKMDVDHARDLQAGGKDAKENMWYLDQSVNRSFGAQLKNRMVEHPPGTKFGGVELVE